MLASNEKEALHGIDDRISMLEKRLSNAKAARDAYVHHLRGRYPDWKPPLPSLTYPELTYSTLSIRVHI
uniref:Uncharacterized protein n=1 Tax=Caenorhabditis japonica TaxID=281687 RepID=A0A8R1IMG6_CAEJA